MPAAYIIAEVDVTDAAQYERYKQLSSAAMDAYGARVCVRGGPVETLEGDRTPQRVVVLRFDSVEAAKRFYSSPEYTKARATREGAALMRMIVVEAVD